MHGHRFKEINYALKVHVYRYPTCVSSVLLAVCFSVWLRWELLQHMLSKAALSLSFIDSKFTKKWKTRMQYKCYVGCCIAFDHDYFCNRKRF